MVANICGSSEMLLLHVTFPTTSFGRLVDPT